MVKPIDIILSIILIAVAFLFNKVFNLPRKYNSFIYKALDFVWSVLVIRVAIRDIFDW